MSITEIYEKVNMVVPMEQRRFFNYYEDTVNELMAMYSVFVIEKDSEYTPPKVLNEKDVVLPLYHGQLLTILFSSATERKRTRVNS